MKIRKVKKAKWREYVENVDDKSIFQIHHYLTNISMQSLISTLDDRATTHEEKITILQKVFFLPSSSADLKDIFHQKATIYPPEISFSPYIMIQ